MSIKRPRPEAAETLGSQPRQRVIGSCSFCYTHKIKCDKAFPCSNCRKRGLSRDCAQAPSMVRGKLHGGDATLATSHLSIEELRMENFVLRERLRLYTSSNTATTVEHLGLGPTIVRDDTKLLNLGRFLQSMPDDNERGKEAVEFRTQNESSQDFHSIMSLVPLLDSFYMVDLYFRYVSFLNCVLHQETFRNRHKFWIDQIQRGEVKEDWPWLALYFTVISATACIALPVEGVFDARDDALSSNAKIWLTAAMTCLQKAEYVINTRTEILQAIMIIPLSGHVFDKAEWVRSYSHTALQLAAIKQIHVGSGDETGWKTEEVIQSEIHKRIWVNLAVQENFPPAVYADKPLIYPSSVIQSPANINDSDLSSGSIRSRPKGQLTDTTYLRFLGKIAEIYRSYHLAYAKGGSAEDLYAFVLQCDARLYAELEECPPLSLAAFSAKIPLAPLTAREPDSEILRLSGLYMVKLNTNFARLLLHRYFFVRAFNSEAFATSRFACLESAYVLIEHLTNPSNPLYLQKICWTPYVLSIATSILVTERSKETDESVQLQLTATINKALHWLLARTSQSAFARRGYSELVRLADSLATFDSATGNGAEWLEDAEFMKLLSSPVGA